ncbi:hypothetical protein SH1V18_27220 [Vallitalea longa]|uniref:Uncharacterized protein n=1 Tax=Vallitalea longa TaxID=2936439 RepID=A0A9W6DG71_9FIRM|nr:hypothetical protein [Vallitalea longa]GKX30242.1 hypothetical protein SH1V18_27220 [Vallitalea longa]
MKRIVIFLLASIFLISCTNSKDILVSKLEQANNKISTYDQQLSDLASKNDNLLMVNQKLENTIEDNKLIIANMQKIIEDNKSKIDEFKSKMEEYENKNLLLQNEMNYGKKELSSKNEVEYEEIDGYKIPIKHSKTFYAFSIDESYVEDGDHVIYSYDTWEIKNGKKTMISNINSLEQYWYRETTKLPSTINLEIKDPIQCSGFLGLALYNGARNTINEYMNYGLVKKAILYVNLIPKAVLYFDEAMGRQEVYIHLKDELNLQLEFKIVETYNSFSTQKGVAISHIELFGGR